MAGNPEPTSEDVQALMTRIRDKSALIVKHQAQADAGRFTTYGGAMGLQKLRQERKALQGQLPQLHLV